MQHDIKKLGSARRFTKIQNSNITCRRPITLTHKSKNGKVTWEDPLTADKMQTSSSKNLHHSYTVQRVHYG